MAKTEVYSWRVDPATKMGLEEEARREGISLAELMDRMSRSYLEERRRPNDDELEQTRIQAAAAKCFGTIAAGPYFSENVREKVRARVRARFARNRSA
jgi:hypothetical protein